jgi:signal transduction histidine kinase
VVDVLEGLAIEKGISISFGNDDDGIIFGDHDLLFRAVFNILDNAIKYSYYPQSEPAEKRFINIDSRRHSMHGDWLVSVKSYGVGIDDDEIQNGSIFQYGKRGRHADDRGRGGTGIGLAEAKRIIEAHRGEIRIESKRLEVASLTIVRVIIRN